MIYVSESPNVFRLAEEIPKSLVCINDGSHTFLHSTYPVSMSRSHCIQIYLVETEFYIPCRYQECMQTSIESDILQVSRMLMYTASVNSAMYPASKILNLLIHSHPLTGSQAS